MAAGIADIALVSFTLAIGIVTTAPGGWIDAPAIGTAAEARRTAFLADRAPLLRVGTAEFFSKTGPVATGVVAALRDPV